MTTTDLTTHPVPTTNPTGTSMPVRQMVALIVLATHLPMPVRITFQGAGVGDEGRCIMALSFRSVADGQAWGRHLGVPTDTRISVATGRAWLDHGVIRWHGWLVHLEASDTLSPRQRLDQATTAGLEAITGGDA